MLQSGLLGANGVAHAFTMRPDNLSLPSGPQHNRAAACRAALCVALGAEAHRLTTMRQVHGAGVAVVSREQEGTDLEQVDALVVDRPGVPLLALSADCPLVVVCDPVRAVLGVAHAGWRGTLAGIARGLVDAMVTSCGARPPDMVAAVGPSAGPDRYEVGPEVRDQAAGCLPGGERFFRRRGDTLLLDLWTANVDQLCRAGLDPRRIDLAAHCTIGDERFHSYRRDGAATGHAALVALLR